MKEQEFKDRIVNGRIAMLLGLEDIELREKEFLEETALILEGLDQQIRQKIETHINRMFNRMSDSEQQIYIEGLKDGIRLMKWIRQL